MTSGQTPIPVQNVMVDSRPSTGFETIDLQYNVGTDSPLPESRWFSTIILFIAAFILVLLFCQGQPYWPEAADQSLIQLFKVK